MAQAVINNIIKNNSTEYFQRKIDKKLKIFSPGR